ncbi:ABC transporter permease [Rhizobium sp. SSA_523]|uniref:ABC transporter permease n=1 Tax=Rhizobium sp. SSA_523 TaxID=2952477 RepID=UPI00209037AC|nr:ABC transporter permease [Rhizobium sp. SSA_523]MCO5732357.1 ABC transporter permease [Rhizobium sp. SSA_523]WKC21245.1 ABC transporter permease [Rhizobium sp. SSA_523]
MTTSSPTQSDTLPHYVRQTDFDPYAEDMATSGTIADQASQLKLMWWRFKRHRLALISGIVLLIGYLMITVVEMLAPYKVHSRNMDFIFAPPQQVRLFHEGELVGPFVYGQTMTLDMQTLRRVYSDNKTDVQRLRFFCAGEPYRFWGLVDANFHFVCPAEGGQLFLMGTDRLGRDIFSRILYGARISLTIGLLGVMTSFVLGIVIGGLAGYWGGWFDLVVQRIIEVLQSIPTIPLWLALAAIMPVDWSPLLVYLGITFILGLLDWTGLARAVRSKLLALREEDYVLAAQLMGAKTPRIIGRHLVPGFMSHLIASATLTIPGMILGETTLSFLGLGLRPPITSWGVLLTEARSVSVLALYPWLLFPVVPVIFVILAFNFLGDGLRDAADPYK